MPKSLEERINELEKRIAFLEEELKKKEEQENYKLTHDKFGDRISPYDVNRKRKRK